MRPAAGTTDSEILLSFIQGVWSSKFDYFPDFAVEIVLNVRKDNQSVDENILTVSRKRSFVIWIAVIKSNMEYTL